MIDKTIQLVEASIGKKVDPENLPKEEKSISNSMNLDIT